MMIELSEVQKWIDENNIFKVEFGHYEEPLMMKWVPIKTHRINLEEAFDSPHGRVEDVGEYDEH